jgi:hypothetical protein
MGTSWKKMSRFKINQSSCFIIDLAGGKFMASSPVKIIVKDPDKIANDPILAQRFLWTSEEVKQTIEAYKYISKPCQVVLPSIIIREITDGLWMIADADRRALIKNRLQQIFNA